MHRSVVFVEPRVRAVQTFAFDSPAYRAARPTYPPAVYAWLADVAPGRAAAWDCATGNGQAALGLAAHFAHVQASDVSDAQIAQAPAHPRVSYAVHPAAPAPYADGRFDVVTVAQALHWFADDAFFREAHRVLKPGGVFAAWGYGFFRVAPAIDRAIRDTVLGPLDPYWVAEHRLLWNGYRDVAWPFAPLEAPPLAMSCWWSLDELLAYMRTWSAWKRYVAEHDASFEADVVRRLRGPWGPSEQRREVVMDTVMRAGRRAEARA